MSKLTYTRPAGGSGSSWGDHKALVWLFGEVKTPPFSEEARVEAGVLLRELQAGVSLGLPHSRPMPGIGRGCHELRITDKDVEWRILYRLDDDAVVIAGVMKKKSEKARVAEIRAAMRRLDRYDRDVGEGRD